MNTVRYLFFIPLLEREQQILVVSLSQPLPPINGSRVQTAIKRGVWSLRDFNMTNKKGRRKPMNATQLCTSLGKRGTWDRRHRHITQKRTKMMKNSHHGTLGRKTALTSIWSRTLACSPLTKNSRLLPQQHSK